MSDRIGRVGVGDDLGAAATVRSRALPGSDGVEQASVDATKGAVAHAQQDRTGVTAGSARARDEDDLFDAVVGDGVFAASDKVFGELGHVEGKLGFELTTRRRQQDLVGAVKSAGVIVLKDLAAARR